MFVLNVSKTLAILDDSSGIDQMPNMHEQIEICAPIAKCVAQAKPEVISAHVGHKHFECTSTDFQHY